MQDLYQDCNYFKFHLSAPVSDCWHGRTESFVSKLKAIILAPFLHNLNEVLNLWVARILEHIDDLDEALLVLSSSYNHLEDSDGGTTLAFPELGVGIQTLEHVEGLDRKVELAHLVAIISDQV